MATRVQLRWKPDQFKTNMEAMVLGESSDGSTGTVVLTAQAFIYDEAEIANINQAVPGDNSTERFVTVCYEGPIQFDLPALSSMTAANRNAALNEALDSWGTTNYGLIQSMSKVNRSARRRNPRNIVAPV